MKIEIVGQPLIRMPLTVGQVDLLLKLSAHHYSGDCRELSAPAGSRGASDNAGMLSGWRNQIALRLEDSGDAGVAAQAVSASLRQLDLCLKVLELRGVCEDSERKMASALSTAILQALRFASETAHAWRAELELEITS